MQSVNPLWWLNSFLFGLGYTMTLQIHLYISAAALHWWLQKHTSFRKSPPLCFLLTSTEGAKGKFSISGLTDITGRKKTSHGDCAFGQCWLHDAEFLYPRPDKLLYFIPTCYIWWFKANTLLHKHNIVAGSKLCFHYDSNNKSWNLNKTVSYE